MLNRGWLNIAARKYVGGEDLTNPRLSPIYGSFRGLKNLFIFTGSADILYPDAKKLKEKLEKEGVPFKFFEYPGMFHDWMMFLPAAEAKKVVEQLGEVIVIPFS